MRDPCYWCNKNRCRLTHKKAIKTYYRKLHQTAVKTLRRDGWLKPEGLTQYESIVWDNALRNHENAIEAVERVRWQGKHSGFLSPLDSKGISSKLTAFLAKRKRTKGSYWPRRKKNPPAVKI